MLNGEPVCYYSAKVEEFLDNPDPPIRWVELKNDLSVGKVADAHKAGIISFRLAINDRSKIKTINYEDYAAWKTPLKNRPAKVYKARIYIYQCRDLPSADDDGQSDPYIKVWDQLDATKTKCIEDNNNPIFYEGLDIQVIEAESFESIPPFVLDVYDRDPLSQDDFIGRCIVPVSEAAYSEQEEIPKPKWHPCRVKPGAPTQGEILVSFSIMLSDYTFKGHSNISDTVKTKEFQVDINILGLRDLQSAGILPIKKAFVQFGLKSLVSPEDGRALTNIRTLPGPTGPNPTINTLVSFKLPLPTSPLYCPKLVCSVFDYIFMGVNQPLVGTFTIPIGELIFELKKERKTESQAIQRIVDEIERITKEEGIPTYSVQTIPNGSRSSSSLPERLFEAKIEEMKGPREVKSKMNVDDEMRKPLLLSAEEDDDLNGRVRFDSRALSNANQKL